MGPIRELGKQIQNIPLEQVRPVQLKDFINSMSEIRPATSESNLKSLLDWNEQYGSTRL